MELDNQARHELEQRFEFIKLLGKGAFGYVYECLDKNDQKIYAVKVISKNNVKKSKIQCLREEAKILENVNHHNIIKVYEFVQTNTCIFLRMEIVSHGTLESFMKKRKQQGKPFSDEEISKIMGSIFRSVNHIHSVSIIHRDIKPENILMPNQHSLDDLKMADFGLSTRLDFYYPKTATMKCGTMLYMAPQILNNYAYTKSVDVWSCSIIMFMLFKGKHPFYEPEMTTQMYKNKIKKIVFPALQNRLAQDFLSRISKVQPNERYCTQEALKHPWMTRNSQDQIPLSLHQSFSGFQKSHQISHAIKLMLTSKQLFSINKRHIVPSQYRIRNEKLTIDKSFNPNKTKNSASGKNIYSLNDIQMLFGKKQEPKERVHKKSVQLDGDSPTIKKLNKIFESLFDKNSKKDRKWGEGFTIHPLPRQHFATVPNIQQYKGKIEMAIEKVVLQFKGNSKVVKKRILPSSRNNEKKNEQGFFKDDYGRSNSLDSNSSNNKVRYRKRSGAALKQLYD